MLAFEFPSKLIFAYEKETHQELIHHVSEKKGEKFLNKLLSQAIHAKCDR